MRFLKKAGGAEIFIVAPGIDIGPEFAGGCGNAGLAGQIFATFDQRRREAEVEAEQGRDLRGAVQKPGEHLFTRPDVAGPHQSRRGIADRFRDGDALVPFTLRARPVDRDEGVEPCGQTSGG